MALIPSNGRPRPGRRAAARTVAAAVCAGLLVGCGGSSKPSAPASATPSGPATTSVADALPAGLPQKSACGMITQAEVEAAVGAKVGPGKEDSRSNRSLCSFTLVAKPTESVVLISTTSSGVPAYVTAARGRATAPASVTAGDEAFVTGAQGLVRRGNTMVAILVVLRAEPTQLTVAATKLAQAVGPRI